MYHLAKLEILRRVNTSDCSVFQIGQFVTAYSQVTTNSSSGWPILEFSYVNPTPFSLPASIVFPRNQYLIFLYMAKVITLLAPEYLQSLWDIHLSGPRRMYSRPIMIKEGRKVELLVSTYPFFWLSLSYKPIHVWQVVSHQNEGLVSKCVY